MPERRDFEKLFVIGCPRSGTTWVQLLLSRFPTVATAPETQIFAYYLDHFRRQWRHEHEGPGSAFQGNAGLSRLLSEEEFEELCRQSARTVLEKIAGRNPDAAMVVEKSPRHALQADFIQRIFPDAYFLHVVRDPRDTAASLLAAGRSWGQGWAPRSAIRAARMWVEHIEGAHEVARRTERYRTVQYEAMKRRPGEELQEILTWLGIATSDGECQRAVEACELEKLQKVKQGGSLPIPAQKSPDGFFRKGSVGGWQAELSRSDVRVIEHICGDRMRELGYETVTRGRRMPPLRIPVHDSIQRVRESLDWQISRLLDHV